MEGISVLILIVEAGTIDEPTVQELIKLLSKRTNIQVMECLQGAEGGSNSDQQVLSFPGLEIHVKEQTVYRDSTLIPLSYYEFLTLYYLARHPGWVFTRQQIYEFVWQEPDGDCNTAVTNIISQIRKKLNPDNPKNSYIKTVVNSGYKFEAKAT